MIVSSVWSRRLIVAWLWPDISLGGLLWLMYKLMGSVLQD